MEVKLIEDR